MSDWAYFLSSVDLVSLIILYHITFLRELKLLFSLISILLCKSQMYFVLANFFLAVL